MDGAEGMRVRLEIEYDDGTKNVFQFEGRITREQLVRCLDMIEFEKFEPRSSAFIEKESLSLMEQLELFIKYSYPYRWFTSSEIKEAFERAHATDIKLTTLSTYLSRLHDLGILERKGGRKRRLYRVMEEHHHPDFVGEGFNTDKTEIPR
jgi:hypothetical protein